MSESEIVASKESEAISQPDGKKAVISGAIQVNTKQRGNPILKSIRNVPWEFCEGIVPDYIVGQRACAMFLSVRYHTLNPNYIHDRLKDLGSSFELRILLVQVSNKSTHYGTHFFNICVCQVDVKDPHHVLKQLMRISILAELTLMLAWSQEEAGKILETYKAFEKKPPDMIMEKANPDSHSKLVEALTSIRSVNKTDAATLLGAFGNLESIVEASIEDLSMCPGFGPHKAQRLHKVLHENFKTQTCAAKTATIAADKEQL